MVWIIAHIVLAYLLYRYPNAKWKYAIPIVYGCMAIYLAHFALFLRIFT